MIRTLVIDDELLARENIILRLADEADFEVCGQADNGHDALLLVDRMNPDVIFLDIDMPGLKGIDAARELSSRSNTLIIFVTAYEQYAIDAFQVNALDYLQKPIGDLLFLETLKRIRHQLASNEQSESALRPEPQNKGFLKRLGIKDTNSISMIDVNSIEVIEVAGDYLCISASGKTHIHRQPLTSLVQLLDPTLFVRIHRSHAINLDFMQALNEGPDGYMVLMKSGRSLAVSRRYHKPLRDRINN
tara:strand:- start:51842 stop:52579 length:738 start_codon:yes stop_codon:yes gene_type:complete